ncbi:MAG: serine/threonine-protein kinase [Planctomycetota bacterium]
MRFKPTRPGAASPIDDTLDSIPVGTPSGGISQTSYAPACRVAMTDATAPGLSRETNTLLRSRLRLASMVLAVGFALFLVRDVFLAEFTYFSDSFVFFCHVATTLTLALVALTLCKPGPIPNKWLRLAEQATFGFPALQFLAFQYLTTLRSCEAGNFEFPEGPWLILMFTYALFIPNILPRAVAVLTGMAAIPIATLFWMLWAYPCVATFASPDEVTGIVLMLLISAGAGAFGVDTIRTLRREAFAARQLGQYRLTRRIGAGGMGEVYLAEHRLLKRPCVVKLIRPDKAGNPQALARFQREVQATAKLSHWNTIEIFDYGSTDDGTFYYVMEFLPGMSLGELVDRFGPMPPGRVIHLLRQACDALSEAHAVGLIHRDIKPGNIFAAKRGGVFDVVKLLDFGLVKHVMDDEQPLDLTTEGSITGSPLYMSPEQAMGGDVDGRSDVYSLGAVAYMLLTGQPPFKGDRPLKVIFAHAHEAVVPPSQVNPAVPTDLERVVLRCLAKNPTERYASAADLAAALGDCEAAGSWTRDNAARWWQDQEVEVPEPAEA